MRLLSIFVLTLSLAACSTSKKTQQPTASNTNRPAPTNQPGVSQSNRTSDPTNVPANTDRVATNANRPSAARPLNADPNAPSRAAVVRVNPGNSGSGAPSSGGTPEPGQYTITAIKGKFLAIDSSAARVYLNVYIRTPDSKPITDLTDFGTRFLVNYVLYPDYNNRERLGYGNVPITPETAMLQGEYITLMFEVKRPKEAIGAVMLTEITEVSSGKKALNDLQLRFRAPRITDRFTLFDANGKLPQLRNFVSRNDTIVIRDVTGTNKPLYGFRYKHEFDAASSPMNTSNRPAARTLGVDSTLTVMTNQPFRLPKEGLYFFLEDTTETYGIGLMVTDNRYPKLTRPEKLVKPVMYVSTSTEMNELNGATDAKKAFDKYWLGLMTGNEEVARRAIRAYFNRVEEANNLFTTYKEGWKTDKGMIYIVLGPPDRVQRSRDREVWVYNRRANVSEINFTFNRKPNQFVDDHYELVRYAEYQPVWYPIVEAWRTGAIRE